jgi:hypothetical protein
MSELQTIIVLFWLTGLLACCNVFLLFRRRLHRDVPWFAVYLITVVINEVVCGYLYQCVQPLFYWYYIGWIFQGTAVVLGSMFTIEVIRNALVDYPTVRHWGQNILIGVAVALLFLAIITLPYGSEKSGRYIKATTTVVRSARMIQLGVIVVFFAFTSYLALSWRRHQVRILLGYGLYVSVSLAAAAYSSQMGPDVGWKTMLIDADAYLLTLLGWLVCMFRTEPKAPLNLPPSASKDLARWNEALTDLMKR